MKKYRNQAKVDVNKESALAAGIFRAFYVKPADKISLLIENWVRLSTIALGALRVGATPHPLKPWGIITKVLSDLKTIQPKILIMEEKFAWDEKRSRPSYLIELIARDFPELIVFIVSSRFGNDLREKGAGFFGTYSWNVVRQFIEPYNGFRYHAPEGTDEPETENGFLWCQNERGLFFLKNAREIKKMPI